MTIDSAITTGRPLVTAGAGDPVYVVVVNLNRWSDTVECLESVLRSDYPNTRVIVVDNGSTDDSVRRLVEWATGARPYTAPANPAMAEYSWPPLQKPIEHVVLTRDEADNPERTVLPSFTLIVNGRNDGFSAGNNVALRLLLSADAAGYALLINNDMVVAPNAIAALVDRIEADPQIGATGGVILDYAQPEIVQMVGGARSTHLGWVKLLGTGLRRDRVPEAVELAFVGGGCLLARLRTLRDVGLLDETFFVYGEDYDWGERMRRRGLRLAYSAQAEVWHKGGGTVVTGSPFQDYHMVRGTLAFVGKHKPRLMPVAFVYSVLRSLAPKIIRRQWRRARAVLRAYADHVRGTRASPAELGSVATPPARDTGNSQ
jgi:GT2 family glycosyltransferase